MYLTVLHYEFVTTFVPNQMA